MLTRKMKDSGIEWIGEIPEDWLLVKYKRFAKSGMGITLLKSDLLDRETEGSIPVYSATQGNEFFGYTENKKLLLESGDLVIPARGNSIGHIKVVDKTATSTQTTIYSKVFSNEINIMFLKYCGDGLKDNWFEFDNTAIPQITVNQVNNNPVPYPNLKEQEKIVKTLNEITRKVDNILKQTQQSIEELKKYKQSLITETVTKGLDPNVEMKDSGIEWIGEIPKHWLITRPNRISTIVRGNSGFQKVDMKNTGDYVAVQYGQVYKLNVLDEKYQLYVDGKFYKEDQVVQKGDTILVSTSETMEDLGHSCFYNRKDIGLLGGEQLCLKPNKKVLFDKFLYYATTYFNLELNQYATGLKVYRFKLDDLKKINMIIPPTIEEQRQIVSYLDEQTARIDKLIEDKTKIIEELKNYKKSLIYEYVTGKKEA